MNPNRFSLSRLFPVDALTEEQANAIAKSRAFLPSRNAIENQLKGVALPRDFMAQVIQEASALLDIDLRGILASAWSAAPALRKFLDSTLYPPRKQFAVTLVEHAILSEHAPKLHLEINGVEMSEIPFQITLELLLKGVVLVIQGGKIKEAMVGHATAKGLVKLGEYRLLERESGPLDLPFSLAFEPGVPLGAAPPAIHDRVHAATA